MTGAEDKFGFEYEEQVSPVEEHVHGFVNRNHPVVIYIINHELCHVEYSARFESCFIGHIANKHQLKLCPI